MKKYILVSAMLIALAMVSCKENPYMPSPGDNDKNSDTIPILKADTNGIVVSVDSALAICKSLANGGVTAERYKISGIASSIGQCKSKSFPNAIDFQLTVNQKDYLECFACNNINNYPFRNMSNLPGDGTELTVIGTLKNFSGKAEMENCFIVRIDKLVAPTTDTK